MFSLPGSLTVVTGDGDDAVGIIGNVGGSVAVNLGSSIPGSERGNVLVIGPTGISSVDTRIGGSLSVVGGNQNDSMELIGTSVKGAVSVALGSGNNTLDLFDETGFGSLSYVGGSGTDSIDSAGLTVRNGMSVSTGAGNDAVTLHQHAGTSPTVVGGALFIDTGADDDYVDLAIDARQAVSVITGGGNDEVHVYSKAGLGLAIDSGAGNDRVEIEFTDVGQNAVIIAGAGNDVVTLANSRIRYCPELEVRLQTFATRSRIVSAVAVHANGFGFLLCSSR